MIGWVLLPDTQVLFEEISLWHLKVLQEDDGESETGLFTSSVKKKKIPGDRPLGTIESASQSIQ